jgi:hypothetical protein
MPGEDMLIDAVDERAIQIGHERWGAPHGLLLPLTYWGG